MEPSFDISIVVIFVLLLINWFQYIRIASNMKQNAMVTAKRAEEAKQLLASNTLVANDQLQEIHKLVNSRLHEALTTIEALKALLLLVIRAEIAADDPRVQDAIAKIS